jgi:hypothetical protein
MEFCVPTFCGLNTVCVYHGRVSCVGTLVFNVKIGTYKEDKTLKEIN